MVRTGAGGRPGHSLPELIVAVTFLATALVGVGASSLLGARWTVEAVGRQAAAGRAAALLDSLAVAPGVDPGSTGTAEVEGRWRFQWSVSDDRRLVLRAETWTGRPLFRLESRLRIPPPELPFADDPGTGTAAP